MKMAVSSQKTSPVPAHGGLVPRAFSTEATHLGPRPSVIRGWSDSLLEGVTHVICARLQFLMSVSTLCEPMTFLLTQSGPVQSSDPAAFSLASHMCRMEFGASHIESGESL